MLKEKQIAHIYKNILLLLLLLLQTLKTHEKKNITSNHEELSY